MKNNKVMNEIINLKSEKGISMMVLIITIIVLLIISGTTIYFSTTSVEGIVEKQDISVLNMIQEIVMAQYSKAEYLGETNIKLTESMDQPRSYFGEMISAANENKYIVKVTDENGDYDLLNPYKGLFPDWAIYSDNILNNPNFTYDDCYYRLGPVELKELGIIDTTGTNESVHTYIVKYSTGEVYDETMHTKEYYVEGNKNIKNEVANYESNVNIIREENDFID